MRKFFSKSFTSQRLAMTGRRRRNAGGLASPVPAAAQQQFVSIGTGGVTGVYFLAGGAICRLVNKDRADHGCAAQ